MKLIHKLLFRLLPLEWYLRVVSALFFVYMRLGLGRRSEAVEYVRLLPQLVRRGDTCIDIGANLGYYSRPLSRLVGTQGRVYAVEPVPVIGRVLRRNLRRCANVEILPYALGAENRRITMSNDSVLTDGYFGTGRNRVDDSAAASGSAAANDAGTASGSAAAAAATFEAEMRRGSELFGGLERVDFIKCDIEGYELHVMRELRPLLERHRPTVLIETGGENRPQIVALFTELDYRGMTLDRGRLIPLAPDSTKDIVFLHD